MAIQLRNPIKINPVDVQDKSAVGVRLPFGSKRSIFTLDYTTRDHAKSKLTNLLLTSPGERINQPNFGVGVKNLLFENNIDLNFLKNQIQTQVSQFLGNIEITEIQTGSSDDQHTIFISITYKSLLDNEEDSIQLNFN